MIRQSQKYEPKLLLEAWQRFEKEEICRRQESDDPGIGGKIVSRQAESANRGILPERVFVVAVPAHAFAAVVVQIAET